MDPRRHNLGRGGLVLTAIQAGDLRSQASRAIEVAISCRGDPLDPPFPQYLCEVLSVRHRQEYAVFAVKPRTRTCTPLCHLGLRPATTPGSRFQQISLQRPYGAQTVI